MTGRVRLSWVTALTVASLLLGGGALNAFAERGGNGNGHGGGSGKAEHQQQVQHQNQQQHNEGKAAEKSNNGSDRAAEVRRDVQASAAVEERRGINDDDAAVVEDLVAEPDQVTGETRPGLGCGDQNHEHTGAPGNPDLECKDKHNDDDDQGEAEVEEVEAEEG